MLPKDQDKLSKMIYSSEHYKDWKRIARSSQQYEANDIANDAFLFVMEKWTDEFDLSNSEDWAELKHQMWNKYAYGIDRILKSALNIDKSSKNNCDEAIHPILLGISSPASTEPLQGIIDDEDQQILAKKQEQQIHDNSFSMALAYAQLFESLKPKLLKYTYLNIADYMKMSYSWLRRCLKRAEKLQKTQHSLFDSLEYASLQHLASWRKFKLSRTKQPKFTPILENQLKLFQHWL